MHGVYSAHMHHLIAWGSAAWQGSCSVYKVGGSLSGAGIYASQAQIQVGLLWCACRTGYLVIGKRA
jgi:hypothetical protein